MEFCTCGIFTILLNPSDLLNIVAPPVNHHYDEHDLVTLTG